MRKFLAVNAKHSGSLLFVRHFLQIGILLSISFADFFTVLGVLLV